MKRLTLGISEVTIVRTLIPFVFVTVFCTTSLVSAENEAPERLGHRVPDCSSIGEHVCSIHDVPFEAFEVPIAYGYPAGEIASVGLLEYKCRYKIAKQTEFPSAAPESVSGGCILREEKTIFRCACPICASEEFTWKEQYGKRDDVPPYRPWEFPEPPTNVDTDLALRIQEIRALEETEVADCLEQYWDTMFGDD